MHLRDEFAARAMESLILLSDGLASPDSLTDVTKMAETAYGIAEVMLLVRYRVAQMIDDRGQKDGIVYNFDQPGLYPGTESEDEQQPDHVQSDSRNGQ